MSDRPKVRTMPISNQQKASAKRLMRVDPRRAVRVGSPGRLLALASRREMPPDPPIPFRLPRASVSWTATCAESTKAGSRRNGHCFRNNLWAASIIPAFFCLLSRLFSRRSFGPEGTFMSGQVVNHILSTIILLSSLLGLVMM